jgi:hypothetical protein
LIRSTHWNLQKNGQPALGEGNMVNKRRPSCPVRP